jgi:LPXTG-motif cell wall-anchored protein
MSTDVLILIAAGVVVLGGIGLYLVKLRKK